MALLKITRVFTIVALGPESTLVVNAANGEFEPNVTDAKRCTNVSNANKASVAKLTRPLA